MNWRKRGKGMKRRPEVIVVILNIALILLLGCLIIGFVNAHAPIEFTPEKWDKHIWQRERMLDSLTSKYDFGSMNYDQIIALLGKNSFARDLVIDKIMYYASDTAKGAISEPILVIGFMGEMVASVTVVSRADWTDAEFHFGPRETASAGTRVPPNYISLEDAINQYRDILVYDDFEDKFVFSDLDERIIIQASFNDAKYMVEYQDKLFVNADLLNEVLNSARATVDLRNKDYKIGEEIPLFSNSSGGLGSITLVISGVSREDDASGNQNYIIKISDEYHNQEELLGLFDHIETYDGSIYRNFSVVDPSTVEVKMPKAQSVKYIFVKHLTNEFCVRKVLVG
jgi:hypothetical protein